MILTNATDINLWANRREAQSQLPRVLRRLIHATCSQLERIGFPADESIQSGGWDGIVALCVNIEEDQSLMLKRNLQKIGGDDISCAS